jgi:o-succinylbenzoate synthase
LAISALDQGYVRIKLKIEPGWDIEVVRAVRERFADIPLQVDANAAYRLADGLRLAELDAFGLLLIEQPLADEDLRGHAALAREIRTPICLDESITSASAAVAAIELGACSVVNIKAGRVGACLRHGACMMFAQRMGSQSGAAACLRRDSGALPTSRLPLCPGSHCPEISPRRTGTGAMTS